MFRTVKVIVLFCPKCGSIIFPKDGVFTCSKCGTSTDSGASESFTTDAKKVDTIVQSSDTVLPKVRIECPKCKHTEATVTVRQTRAADEPETMIYRCCNPKCNHSWREY